LSLYPSTKTNVNNEYNIIVIILLLVSMKWNNEDVEARIGDDPSNTYGSVTLFNWQFVS